MREILFAGMHSTRREILAHLVSSGRARFTQLAERTGYDPVLQCGSFYYHLSKLEEMGMVGRDKQGYVATSKGRRASELIEEAASPERGEVGRMLDEEREEGMEVRIEIREFKEADIPMWMKASEGSKMFRGLLEPKTEKGREFLDGLATHWREEAENLVHGVKTSIRPSYAQLLSTSEEPPDVEGEERFSFGAFTDDSIVGLVVGVVARQRSMGSLPMPGVSKGRRKRKRSTASRKPFLHLVGHITGLWTDRRFEKKRKQLVKRLLDKAIKHLASKKVVGLQLTLFDDLYLEDLKSLGVLTVPAYHGVYLPPELSKVDVDEGWDLPRSPHMHPVIDAPLSLGLVGRTPARVTSSKTWYQYSEFQLIGSIW